MAITGKGNTLEYIASSLPTVPIPQFKRFRKNVKVFAVEKAKRIARKIGYPVLFRSDGPEDRLGASFAGLFYSKVADAEWKAEHAFYQTRYRCDAETVKSYAESRQVPVPSFPIDIIIQKHSQSLIRAVITRHPHKDGALYVDLEWGLDRNHPKRKGCLVEGDSLDELVCIYKSEVQDGFFPEEPATDLTDFERIKEELKNALRDYREIEKLNQFDRGVSYQAELGLLPYSFFQWRPFRIRKFASFKLDEVSPASGSNHVFEVFVPFGITPPEGLSLMHYACFGPREGLGESTEIVRRNEVSKFLKMIGGAVENDEPMAFSFHEIGRYGSALDYHLRKSPKLTIFDGTIKGFGYGWQAHDSFRFLERGSLVALAENAPYLTYGNSQMIYWSDGIQGRIQFLG